MYRVNKLLRLVPLKIDRYSGKDVEAWRNKELTQHLHGIVNLLGVEIPKDDFHVTGNYW